MTTERLKELASLLISRTTELVPAWLPAGNLQGDHWRVGNVQNKPGQSLAINMTDGGWSDYAAPDGAPDRGGSDLISLYAAINGIKQMDAAYRLFPEEPRESLIKDPRGWKPQPFAPEEASEEDCRHYKFGTPSAAWVYRDTQKLLVGYCCRFDLPDGKHIENLTWCRHDSDGTLAWKYRGFAKPRPIYGAELIESYNGACIVIVEGEKAADALRELCDALLVLTWPGGGKTPQHTDWTPLRGKSVILWPDSDKQCGPDKVTVMPDDRQPGTQTMVKLARILDGVGCSAKIIPALANVKDGWDAADAVAEGIEVGKLWEILLSALPYMPKSLSSPEKVKTPEVADPEDPQEPCPNPKPFDELEGDKPKTKTKTPTRPAGGNINALSTDEYLRAGGFRQLGIADGLHYYLVQRGGHILSLSVPGHTPNQLMMLGDGKKYWMDRWPGEKADTVRWDSAVSALFEVAKEMRFDPKAIRGRGCWLEDGKVVYHAGNSVITETGECRLRDYHPESGNVYRGAMAIPVDKDPLTDAQAQQFASFCSVQPFTNPTSAALFGGWLAVATICGAMPWRPHIFLTGTHGVGKSFQLAQVIKPVLGDVAVVDVKGSTTEAAVRGLVGADAFPVTFDETDVKGERGAQRMAAIMELARAASTESGGGIGRGSQTGGAAVYQIRSCFAFAGIRPAVHEAQDVSRIALLEMRGLDLSKPADKMLRDASIMLHKATVADRKYASGLRARSIRNAATISANAVTMARQIAIRCGVQRLGDHLGALLAGWHSLHTIRLLSDDEALSWLLSINIDSYCSTQEVHEDEAPEQSCQSHLMGLPIRVETSGEKPYTASVGELVGYATCLIASNGDTNLLGIRETLSRTGLKLEQDRDKIWWLWVANKSAALNKLFAGSDFEDGGWKAHLRRLPQATDCLIKTGAPGVVYFSAGVKTRATRIRVALTDLHEQ